MPQTQTVEAVILKTYDIGEADRLCILFTRERGKLVARAKGVRKPLSKKSGTLLAPHRATLTIREHASGILITDAQHEADHNCQTLDTYLSIQQGIEILLSVLHDEEPSDTLFAHLVRFLEHSQESEENFVLPFTLCLLQEFGLLPDGNTPRLAIFSQDALTYLELSTRCNWKALPKLTSKDRERFSILCAELLGDHTSRPLRAGAIALETLQ